MKKNISNTYEYLDSITVSNFERKVISGDDFYVYIGRPDCGDCLLFEPMFRNVVDNYKLNDKILYMNVKHFRENNKDKWELFKNKYGFTQTPALIHFNHGENISMIEWDSEKGLSHNRLVDWLQSNDLIK
ncbi:thiol reductase thioredoxin [Thermoanaerobacterium thermosaccharolyticum]|uniref:Thiol reductase thioredoxin n=1 Tax=Thermoanaerobacterium thermosaccharolyticum TaxID=1517 RepID=A0A231VGH8_THETR|nr:thioredoxin family protein [Thermoanaerobacterium thermosaccharolyticum]OXT07229.1 thiol reductase thioredoxin [Thermoanaerobacterium thermosaccharolyticum]